MIGLYVLGVRIRFHQIRFHLLEGDVEGAVVKLWTKCNVPIIEVVVLKFIGDDSFRRIVTSCTTAKPEAVFIAVNPRICCSIVGFALIESLVPLDGICVQYLSVTLSQVMNCIACLEDLGSMEEMGC